MKAVAAHPWDVGPAEAREIQLRLRDRVERRDRLPDRIRHLAGVDVGFEEDGAVTRAAVAVLDFPGLELKATAIARLPTVFPYVPGLLSFRELPAVLAALADLRTGVDVILCDGQGLAHPRRFGIACHLGVLLDVPTIGVGKSRLVGRHAEPGPTKGDWTPLLDGEETIGAVLRTRAGIRPVYVSIGHRVCLETAVRLTLACTTRYRLPETTRQAHRLASQAQRLTGGGTGPEVSG